MMCYGGEKFVRVHFGWYPSCQEYQLCRQLLELILNTTKVMKTSELQVHKVIPPQALPVHSVIHYLCIPLEYKASSTPVLIISKYLIRNCQLLLKV